VLFSEGKEFGRSLGLKVLELHFPHAGVVLWRETGADLKKIKGLPLAVERKLEFAGLD
jgi:hypothetical protein